MKKETFSLSRTATVAVKELRHIVRDPFTLALAIGIPIILVVFFGFAIDYNFNHIPISVFDNDHSSESRNLIQKFTSSEYFYLKTPKIGSNPILEVESERASAALVINPGFKKEIEEGKIPELQLLLDGSDNLKAGIISSYLAGIQAAATREFYPQVKPMPIRFETRYMYNPELNTPWFVVPGLIVIVTGLLSIMMTALTVAREWEHGSMELLLSTPLLPSEVILGKISPYLGLGFINIFMVYSIMRFVFNVPFLGSHAIFFLACFLFISASLAQGLLISVITRHQQKAMLISIIMGLLPAMLLSGFIFPIENMPVFFQFFTMILPPRWFMVLTRGIVLKGAGFMDLLQPFAFLFFMNLFFIRASVKKFKREVDV